MNSIQKKLKRHDKLFSEQPTNWGYLGNLAHVRELLSNAENINMIPPKGKSTGRPETYGFGGLEIGDFISFDKDQRRIVAAAAYSYGKRNGKKFVVRARKGKGVIDVWREE